MKEQMNQPSTNLAVITGASLGIGAAYADRLARRGYDLLLIGRSQKRLEDLATRITGQTGREVNVLAADLTNAGDRARVEQVLRDDLRVTMLVNNAGLGAVAPLLNADVDVMSRMIAVNVDALMRLTYAIVPAFVRRGSGTIVNISSMVAVAPEVLNGVYGGTKAFVLAFSQSLRHEVADKGVRVQVVLPGATATNFWSAAGRPLEQLPPEIVMPVDDLVDAALAGLDRGEFVTVPSLPDVEQWDAYERARQALIPNLSRTTPADRYGLDSRTGAVTGR